MNAKLKITNPWGILPHGSLRIALVILAACLGMGSSPVLAGDTAKEVGSAIREGLSIEKATQKEREAWFQEKTALEREHRALLEEREEQREINRELSEKRDLLLSRVSELKNRIRKQKEMVADLDPFLESTLGNLYALLESPPPFLMAERRDRLDRVRAVLEDPENGLGQKAGKVFDALLVEVEYGRTLEVFQDTVSVEGKPVLVTLLRLGRVSLFFLAMDGERAGYFDVAEDAWKYLPDQYAEEIRRAMDIVQKKRPAEMVTLPIGRLALP